MESVGSFCMRVSVCMQRSVSCPGGGGSCGCRCGYYYG